MTDIAPLSQVNQKLRVLLYAFSAICMLMSCTHAPHADTLKNVYQQSFYPHSDYPPDPWVKGYANKDDCIGGERLSARQFALPQYPKKAWKKGQQGWVMARLDINAQGRPVNIKIEKALPSGYFENATRQAIEGWLFLPPQNINNQTHTLTHCRILMRFRFGRVSLG